MRASMPRPGTRLGLGLRPRALCARPMGSAAAGRAGPIGSREGRALWYVANCAQGRRPGVKEQTRHKMAAVAEVVARRRR